VKGVDEREGFLDLDTIEAETLYKT